MKGEILHSTGHWRHGGCRLSILYCRVIVLHKDKTLNKRDNSSIDGIYLYRYLPCWRSYRSIMIKPEGSYDPRLGFLSGKSQQAPPFPYMQAVILFNLAVYVCHTYLDVRQLRVRRPTYQAAWFLSVVLPLLGVLWQPSTRARRSSHSQWRSFQLAGNTEARPSCSTEGSHWPQRIQEDTELSGGQMVGP